MTSPIFRSGTFVTQATLRRQSRGERDDAGRWGDGQPEESMINAVVQPIGDNREDAVGGSRLLGGKYFYVEPSDDIATLRVADEGGDQTAADEIVYQGVRYRALSRIEWPDYVRIAGVRVEGQ